LIEDLEQRIFSIKFIDIDKDGDKDLIGGNIGTNDFGKVLLMFCFSK
jgi:hypothetical protein